MTFNVERTARARGPYKNGLRKRREIVEAATLVFGQYGYHGGSLKTIADMVGATPATLVSYFGSKELLLVAVLEHWNLVSSQTQGEQGLGSFRASIPLMSYHVEHPGLIQLFLTMSTEATQSDHPARPFILERQQLTRQSMVREFRWAIDHGEIPPMDAELIDREAVLMIGVLDGVELGWLNDPTLDLVGVVRHHIDTSIARWTGSPLEKVREDTDRYLATKAGSAR